MKRHAIFWNHPNKNLFLKNIRTDFYFKAIQKLKLNFFRPNFLIDTAACISATQLQQLQELESPLPDQQQDPMFYFDLVATMYGKHYFQPKQINFDLLPMRDDKISLFKSNKLHRLCFADLPDQSIQDYFRKTLKETFELASTMALITDTIKKYEKKDSTLNTNKAYFIGLFSSLGKFIAIDQYKEESAQKNFLSAEIALCIFETLNQELKLFLFKQLGFDDDFLSTCNTSHSTTAFIQPYANLVIMARCLISSQSGHSNFDDVDLELDLSSAEAMYELTNLANQDFQRKIQQFEMTLNHGYATI